MKKYRVFAALLALVMLLTLLPVSALAAEGADWLIPPMREYRAFTDTPGTICEEAAATCCRAGLMDGVDSKHFLPSSGLSHAQIIVISARLHRLLTGGTLDDFEPISLKGADWWTPYDGYLREQLSALAEDTVYAIIRETPTDACCRSEFFHLLSAVVKAAGTSLPERNAVYAVPDCCDQDILQFYRWGVLGGKDQYGTLRGGDALSRGAAAAMLARLVDPAQRLTFTLKSFDLCRDVLGAEPETVLLTVDGKEVTAALFANQLCTSLYQRKGGADKTLTDAIQFWCDYHAPFQVLAEKRGISLSEEELAESAVYAQSMDGYLGLSAAYWQQQSQNSKLNLKLKDLYCEADWKSGEYLYHSDLEKCSQSLLQTAVPTDALRSMDLRAVYQRLMASPFITWNFQNQ